MPTHSEPMPNAYRISIKALILNAQKRFLIVQEDNGLWELPGGGIDYGETPHECIKREIAEEMGLQTLHIAPQPSYFVTALNINGRWRANVFYVTTVADLNFTPSDECVAIKFVDTQEAQQMKLYPVVSEFLKVFNPKNHQHSS
ncbi:MAG: RNA pyrophosphohydrolase [Microgenomates bacterium OLB23]|nr:MAG: RNA pyrophosphohydrolase [Microgenomates bacterium OLB23]